MQTETDKATFWEHLDVLRGSLWKIMVAILLVATVAFFFKDELFSVILAPQNSNFITYRFLEKWSNMLPIDSGSINEFSVSLINTRLAQQFTTHIRVALYVGFLLTFPYILFVVYQFLAPALYRNERKMTLTIIVSGYVMFMLGVALSYFLIFPLTFRFLGTYQISADVVNTIVLESYIDTLTWLSIMLGIVFEIPVLSWLFAKAGLISSAFLCKYRRHAIITLLFVAAIITSTTDIFTLLIVALPMYLLFEAGICVVRLTEKKQPTCT